MAIITDYEDALYDSYTSVADNDALVLELSSFLTTDSYDVLEESAKEGLIKSACQDLNTFTFDGLLNQSISSPYGMVFPRTSFYYTNGILVDSEVIPPFVKYYIAERCLEILSFGPSDANDVRLPSNIKRSKTSVLEDEFFSPAEMNKKRLVLSDFSSYIKHIKPFSLNIGNVTFLSRS